MLLHHVGLRWSGLPPALPVLRKACVRLLQQQDQQPTELLPDSFSDLMLLSLIYNPQ